MNDLISRQDAIDAIKNQTCLTYEEIFNRCLVSIKDENGWVGGIKDAIEALIDLPSAQLEQQWIPCSERIPHTNGIYIVTRRISDGFECRNITDSCYFDGSNTWHDDTRVNHERKYLADVLAWMPMPEPWKGES